MNYTVEFEKETVTTIDWLPCGSIGAQYRDALSESIEKFVSVAHLVEHSTLNRGAVGAEPTRRTNL